MRLPRRSRSGLLSITMLALAVSASAGARSADAAPGTLPLIRITDDNPVPRCVSPGRLMRFLKARNPKLDPRFNEIAHWYRHWGEAWRVRWDYAFFQMAIETNFLSYRRPDGRMGDVDPRQNNFAGIGTTGGGVPGDRFPDVKTGVLGQIQHLVAYSGERLAAPVAPRTALKQEHIVALSEKLGRPVRYSDLSRRWAVDPKYGSSIEWVASQFRAQQCPDPNEPDPADARAKPPVWTAQTAKPATARPAPPAPRPAERPKPVTAAAPPQAPRPIQPPEAATRCIIATASYGGSKTILLQHGTEAGTHLTALTVLDGFEKSMMQSYIAARAPGATAIGEFGDRTAALEKARQICPPA